MLCRRTSTTVFAGRARYRRPRALPDWPYNLFAMVHGSSRDEVGDKARQIAELLGSACRAGDILFSTRILKKTGLRI